MDGHRGRVRERPRSGRLQGRTDLATPRTQHRPDLRLERALSARELQHRPQPLGNRRRVRRHGESLQRCRRRHHRGRCDQPHDELPQSRSRQQWDGIHEVQLPRALFRQRLPHPVRGEQLPERGQRAGLRAALATRLEHRAGSGAPEDRRLSAVTRAPGRRRIPNRRRETYPAGGARRHFCPSQQHAEGRSPPYVFLEVIGGSGEALSPRDYFGEGYSSGGAADITEFTFTGVGNKFRGVNGEHISQLNPNGTAGNQFSETAWGLMPSDKAVVFLENHDTQHQCGLSYRDGIVFRLANVWMLAQPYGYPSILSSYAFDCPAGNSMGPPSDVNGWTTAVSCAASLETATIGQWVCEHRDPSILRMVSFRHVVAGTNINHWWDDGANAIAFSRGAQGFVAINNETSGVDTTIATGMAEGTYRDLISGGLVQIDSGGSLHFTLAARSALAIDTATRQ